MINGTLHGEPPATSLLRDELHAISGALVFYVSLVCTRKLRDINIINNDLAVELKQGTVNAHMQKG